MATYYVSSLATGGGVGSLADPWTLQEAVANAIAGDVVRILADGVYAPSGTINHLSGTDLNNPIRFLGVNSTGDYDGTYPDINAAGDGGEFLSFDTSELSITYENIRIRDSAGYAVRIRNGCEKHNIVFKKCIIENSAYSNYLHDEGSAAAVGVLDRCILRNATQWGVDTHTGRGGVRLLHCKVYGNQAGGVNDSAYYYPKSLIFGSVIYRNGGPGVLYANPNTLKPTITNSVIAHNSGHGISVDSAIFGALVTNVILYNNDGYGVYTNAGRFGIMSACDYNCYYGNASGPIDINGGSPPGENNVLADPLFVSTVDGSEDFNLQDGSPCKNAGLGYS